MSSIKQSLRASLVACAVLLSAPLYAQDKSPEADATPATVAPEAAEPAGTRIFALDFTLAGVSDYRFRGISLSNKDPAFQPQVALKHNPTGLYARVWGSNIADNGGDNLEIDLVGGISRDVGGFNVDVGATYYAYPGNKPVEYVEIIGVVGRGIGPVNLSATFAYTPRQGAGAPTRGIYAAVAGSVPIKGTPFSLTGTFGIEDNGFYDNKQDFSAGVSADLLGFTVGLSYVDTGHTGGDPLGEATALLSITRTFGAKF